MSRVLQIRVNNSSQAFLSLSFVKIALAFISCIGVITRKLIKSSRMCSQGAISKVTRLEMKLNESCEVHR